MGSHSTVLGQHHPRTADVAYTDNIAEISVVGFEDTPDAGGSAQARSAEAGNVRMRLEKAERAIEAERASVRELQRQLAAARQAPPASSTPGATPVAALST